MTWKTVKSKGQQKRDKQADNQAQKPKFWTCSKCQYQWCFLSRSRCYKCNASMPTLSNTPNPNQAKQHRVSPHRQAGTPYTGEGGDLTPVPQKTGATSMMDHVNAPLMLAKQSGLSIPALIPADMEDTEMDPPPKTRAPKPIVEALPEAYIVQRDQLRVSIEKNESIIKLLDQDHDKERIREFQAMISRDKSAISSLKPLPHRIESLQKVVDAQAQRVMRASQIISNWQLLRDAWQEKHDHYSKDLQEMKRQFAEMQAQEIGTKLEQSGSEQQLSHLQSHVQQLAQLLQGIITTVQSPAVDPSTFTALIGNANQALLSLHGQTAAVPTYPASPVRFPQAPASLGMIAADGSKPTPTGNSPIGITGSPVENPHSPSTHLHTVPTPARAQFQESQDDQHRRTRSHSPRRRSRAHSPPTPSRHEHLEHATMSDAQAQEEMLRAAETACSPITRADMPVAFSPMRVGDP